MVIRLLYYPIGVIQTLPIVVKSKPLDTETCNMINKMAQGCGLNLAVLYERNKHNTGFKYVFDFKITMPLSEHCIIIYWPSPSNQSFYRQIAHYQRGVGNHRVGQ